MIRLEMGDQSNLRMGSSCAFHYNAKPFSLDARNRIVYNDNYDTLYIPLLAYLKAATVL
jgi:hypothetical protein